MVKLNLDILLRKRIRFVFKSKPIQKNINEGEQPVDLLQMMKVRMKIM